MRSTPTRLLFRKKITAVFADGSSKMNLGIATVVRMLQGTANVPVEVAADAAARELLDELALSAGRIVERASAGTFLTSPAKRPDREPQAVPLVPTAPVDPKPRRTRGNGKVKLRVIRKYPALSSGARERGLHLGFATCVQVPHRQTANPRYRGPGDSGLNP